MAHLPDELPLSSSDEELQLEDAASLPSELPLSDAELADAGGDAPPTPAEGPVGLLGGVEALADLGLFSGVAAKAQPAPKRRGRPKKWPLLPPGLQTDVGRAEDLQLAQPGVVSQGRVADAFAVVPWSENDNRDVLLSPTCPGFTPLPPFAKKLFAAQGERARTPSLGLDTEDTHAAAVVNHFMDARDVGQVSLASMEALSVITRVPRKSIQELLRRAAASLLHLNHLQRCCLGLQLSACLPRGNLLHFVEVAAYDETPLPVRIISDVKGSQGAAVRTLASAGQVAIEDTPAAGDSLALSASGSSTLRSSSSAPQKIVQTQLRGGVLVRVGEALVTLIWRQPAPLQVVERTTARVFKHVQSRLSQCTPTTRLFSHRTRAAATDSYSAILAAEASLCEDRWGSANTFLQSLCDIHKTATTHEKTFSLFSKEVTGMIRTALALRNGAAMSRFRRCLAEEISSRLVILEGQCSADAMSYKRFVLRRFVQNGANAISRRILLVLCPTGDWRSKRVEYVVSANTPPHLRDPANVTEFLTSGLMMALTSCTAIHLPKASVDRGRPRHRRPWDNGGVPPLAKHDVCKVLRHVRRR